MSAKGSNVDLSHVEEKIGDLSKCCICMDNYDDPRILPCIHTFCLKCLKQTGANSKKSPGDIMPCPLCRQDFTIPLKGFAGLQKNFFMESLLEMVKGIKKNDTTPPAPIKKCDACLQEKNGDASADIPLAERFCAECNENLCEECCRNHRKNKLLKNHSLLAVGENAPVVGSTAATGFCNQHKEKLLDIYCRDCTRVICSGCLVQSHNNHKFTGIETVEKEFRAQIQSTIDKICVSSSNAQSKRKNLEKRKSELLQKFGDLEVKVNARRNELKELVDRHARTLLQDLMSLRDSKLKEMQIESDEIDMHLSNLKSFTSYCTTLTTKASANEVVKLAKDIIATGVKLQQKHHDPLPDRPLEIVELLLDTTVTDEFVGAGSNIIGELKVGKSKPNFTKKGKVKFIEELQERIEQQNHELEKEKSGNKIQQATIEEQKVELVRQRSSIKKLEGAVNKLKFELLTTGADAKRKEAAKKKVKAGVENGKLVEQLVAEHAIDPTVERVFRAVDRGDYVTLDAGSRSEAYKIQAWKQGNIHLSAPNTYAFVMMGLQLKPGMSFLNLGSGTGYLNTMVGLILGQNGINHGVEYYREVVDYAYQKLQSFINTSEALEEFDFCLPVFVRGNCLQLSPTVSRYDRVYCGAACPPEYEDYMKKLLKVGGILVMPINNKLFQVTRTAESKWNSEAILIVNFASLVLPDKAKKHGEDLVELPNLNKSGK